MKKSLGAGPLVYPTPVFVVATYDMEDKPNVMTAAWGGVCCSKPPCVAVSLREATYTHGNIMERKAFTINIGSKKLVNEIDYFGISTGRNANKLDITGLKVEASKVVDAPYVDEFPLVLECRLKEVVEIGLHTQFIGEVVDVKADEDIVGDNDIIDIEKLQPLLFSPVGRKYHGVGEMVADAFAAGKVYRK